MNIFSLLLRQQRGKIIFYLLWAEKYMWFLVHWSSSDPLHTSNRTLSPMCPSLYDHRSWPSNYFDNMTRDVKPYLVYHHRCPKAEPAPWLVEPIAGRQRVEIGLVVREELLEFEAVAGWIVSKLSKCRLTFCNPWVIWSNLSAIPSWSVWPPVPSSFRHLSSSILHCCSSRLQRIYRFI